MPSLGLPSLAAGKRKNRSAAARATANRAAATGSSTAGTTTVPRSAPSFTLNPVEEQPVRKLKPGELKLPKALRDGSVLYLPDGARYTQKPHLPPSSVPGKSALEALIQPKARAGEATVFVAGVDFDFESNDAVGTGMELYGKPTAGPSRHRIRRLKQHDNWNSLLRPSFLELYLERKHAQTPSLAHEELGSVSATCSCLRSRFQDVSLADWDGYESARIRICLCSPAAEQLMAQGYFPCAPLSPSMAFSMSLLDFISIHSVHVAPNATAWSQTLETFWARSAGPARLQGRLRKRLAMALTWYQVLENQAEAYVNRARKGEPLFPSPPSPLAAPSSSPVEVPHPSGSAADDSDASDEAAGARPGKRRRVDDETEGSSGDEQGQTAADAAAPSPASLEEVEAQAATGTSGDAPSASTTGEREESRPSERLRRICPLCFGAGRPNIRFSEADVIICADGNFSQKRRKCASADPPLQYIDGRFVEVRDVAAMEKELGEKRQGKPRRRRKRGNALRVGEDVLDECERSFTAAQEKVTKASTTYYADTGLMALLCRHDCVLLVANMTTPGERQHYVLALLRKLGEEIPRDWRIGLLYDIACQISRSVDKWGLLEDMAERLTYAVSVFHAYGHQWACQVVYHPRKREGFGLTDGEGCERFWSSIRHLIPGLRVSGYHRRLFVLNRQMDAVADLSRWNCGIWLRRRYNDVLRRTDTARLVVMACGVSEEELDQQWQSQLAAQLKKPPRQSADSADKVIDEILVLMGEIDDLKREAKDTQKALRKAHKMEAAQTEDLRRRKESIERESTAAEKRIATLHESLGTAHCRRLEAMKGDAYLRARVNARALRAAIRHALQAHKFERRKLERAYRNQIMHAKDHAQTRDLVHRREKTITGQVKKYNGQVDHMALLARQGKKPSARTPLPRRLDSKKLFRLDVDDDIWQEDPGLGPQDEGDPPRWQTDEYVKRGIVGMLEMRRCREERERVEAEVRALGRWWVEEHETIQRFKESVAGWTGVGQSAERLLLLHERLRETWVIDLSRSTGLVALFLEADSGGAEAAPMQAVAMVQPEDAVEDAASVDSDDASDAYSSVEDEDEPIADLMDELERAAADLDPEDDDVPVVSAAAEVLNGSIVTAPTDCKEKPDEGVSSQPDPHEGTGSQTGAVSTRAAGTTSVVIDADELSDVDVPTRPARVRARYVAGSFFCDEIDLDRVVGRREWLSGDGLAVFIKGRLLHSGLEDVSVVHPRVLHDVHTYTRHVEEGGANGESYLAPIVKALSELVSPSIARKWLVVGHVVSPPHWTLLEVRWTEREIRFYDSFAREGGYATRLELTVRAFLELCAQHFAVPLDVKSFQWVKEQRGVRQTNWYDCGPFVAADAVSLLESNMASTKLEKDMGKWRETMAREIRSRQETGKGRR